MKPLIGIVGRCGLTVSDEANNIRVPEKYRICIIEAGGVPFIIMPPQKVEYESSKPSELEHLTLEEKDILIRQLELCDGILLPGGLKRFEYDLFILDYALKHDIPILGICLGMQIMTMLDVNGQQVLNLEKIDSNVNHAAYGEDLVHEVNISKDSKLFQILGVDHFMVNSRHRMKITDPGTFTIYGQSGDGVIELIERHDKKFAIGVQWHPEMMTSYDHRQQLLFDSLVKAASEE